MGDVAVKSHPRAAEIAAWCQLGESPAAIVGNEQRALLTEVTRSHTFEPKGCPAELHSRLRPPSAASGLVVHVSLVTGDDASWTDLHRPLAEQFCGDEHVGTPVCNDDYLRRRVSESGKCKSPAFPPSPVQ